MINATPQWITEDQVVDHHPQTITRDPLVDHSMINDQGGRGGLTREVDQHLRRLLPLGPPPAAPTDVDHDVINSAADVDQRLINDHEVLISDRGLVITGG